MAYTREQGIDFWFEYDNTFLLDIPQDVAEAYASLGGFIDRPRNLLRLRRNQGTYPQKFIDDMTPLRDGLFFLASRQLQIIDTHFPDVADLQLAFEDFGQGILWDDRPIRVDNGIPLHMMDGAAASLVGYHRWNGIIRATILLGADESRWLTINRFVALACAIQTLLSPAQNKPDNPPIEPGVLQGLRDKWLVMNADQLDAEFARLPIIP